MLGCQQSAGQLMGKRVATSRYIALSTTLAYMLSRHRPHTSKQSLMATKAAKYVRHTGSVDLDFEQAGGKFHPSLTDAAADAYNQVTCRIRSPRATVAGNRNVSGWEVSPPRIVRVTRLLKLSVYV